MTETTRASAARPAQTPERALMGIPGLDAILGGGLPTNHLYLVEGEPGAGKTTLALQFLLEGASRGERGLYVTLSESTLELEGVALSHGWDLGAIEVFELAAAGGVNEEYTIFHPAEVELQETVGEVLAAVEQANPTRVVFDSLSEMRLLARDPLRFRRQILALKQFFAGRQCTILLLDDRSAPQGDLQLHSLAHGVLSLEHLAMEYGAERRRLQVTKLRGVRFWGGFHDFRICTGGIAVYPRVRSTPKAVAPRAADVMTSNASALDALLGGGLTRGTSTVITGAAGTGKTVLTVQYACAAVERGERVRMFMFDERISTFRLRAEGLGMDLSAPMADGRLSLVQVEPTAMSPGEFANEIVRAVERDGVSLIVIDSVNGYMNAMPAERLLGVQIHELLSYLANHGVTSLLTLVQHGIFGGPIDETVEVSYLADTVVLLRYFEFQGAVRGAISVVKKRGGPHERTIRECRVGQGGLRVGAPLTQFRGVLTGVPEYTGEVDPLMHRPDAARE